MMGKIVNYYVTGSLILLLIGAGGWIYKQHIELMQIEESMKELVKHSTEISNAGIKLGKSANKVITTLQEQNKSLKSSNDRLRRYCRN